MIAPAETETESVLATDARSVPFAKGHGTGNDFVILPDPDGRLGLTADLVAAVCDRRRGIGGDGLLRVVRTAADPEVAHLAGQAEWFMDYRNADGSIAEMCGNGARVFARYLVRAGLAADGRLSIMTRAGVVVAEVGEASITVAMPSTQVYARSTATVAGVSFEGTVASCGNPHLVCRTEIPLARLDLVGVPTLDPAVFPAGANVEFVSATPGPVSPAGPDGFAVRMRVLERGSGETLSCGSGACAVAAVVLRDAGLTTGTVTVEVPGGTLEVSIDGERCTLAGPAVIVATGRLALG